MMPPPHGMPGMMPPQGMPPHGMMPNQYYRGPPPGYQMPPPQRIPPQGYPMGMPPHGMMPPAPFRQMYPPQGKLYLKNLFSFRLTFFVLNLGGMAPGMMPPQHMAPPPGIMRKLF